MTLVWLALCCLAGFPTLGRFPRPRNEKGEVCIMLFLLLTRCDSRSPVFASSLAFYMGLCTSSHLTPPIPFCSAESSLDSWQSSATLLANPQVSFPLASHALPLYLTWVTLILIPQFGAAGYLDGESLHCPLQVLANSDSGSPFFFCCGCTETLGLLPS